MAGAMSWGLVQSERDKGEGRGSGPGARQSWRTAPSLILPQGERGLAVTQTAFLSTKTKPIEAPRNPVLPLTTGGRGEPKAPPGSPRNH